MELELQQLDLRYEAIRTRSPSFERRLVASLTETGQQMPVVVVAATEPNRYVLVDGYKRVRALKRLRQDTVRSMRWEVPEAEALLLERLMRRGPAESPLEQGWLLRELRYRFAMTVEELARRFDRSMSWVSGRLALISTLPEEVQGRVRGGEIVAHAAMKYLVPFARANRSDCLRLAGAIGPKRLTSRQVGRLYAAYVSGTRRTRELLLSDPMLFLRAEAEARRSPEEAAMSPARILLGDLQVLGAVARRVERKLRDGLARQVPPPSREEIALCLRQARADVERLARTGRTELEDA